MKTYPLLTVSAVAGAKFETNTLLQVTQMRDLRRNPEDGNGRHSEDHQALEEGGCIDEYGMQLEYVYEDCTLKDFFIFKGSVEESLAPFKEPTYSPDTYDEDTWWQTESVHHGKWKADCVAYVKMGEAEHLETCTHWCESHGMTCVRGADDAHHQTEGLSTWLAKKNYNRTDCTLVPRGHDRQASDESGCNQKWKTQVCACDKPTTTTTTTTRAVSNTGVESCCIDKDGVPFKGMSEECTNKDFFVFAGSPEDNRGPFIEPTYDASSMGSDDTWSTTPVQEDGWATSCVAYVKTDGGNCMDWCAENGMICQKAMDDAHHQTAGLDNWLEEAGYPGTDCTLHPSSSERQTAEEDGCLQNWKTQICACVKPRGEPETLQNAPPGCVDDSETFFPDVLEDCTNKDFFEFQKGYFDNSQPPSYDPTTYGSDEFWRTKPVQQGDWESSCVAYVHTEGKNCKEWCEEKHMTCTKGMDDAHHQTTGLSTWLEGAGYSPTDCTLLPSGAGRQIEDDNGCLQRWKTQICACQHANHGHDH